MVRPCVARGFVNLADAVLHQCIRPLIGANLSLIRKVRPDFAVLASGDEHLLTSYMIGTDGSQVSLAAVLPELVVQLWAAAGAKDWDRARAIHQTLCPLATAIYRDAPSGRATARLKACLKLLGRLVCEAVRPPQVSATPNEQRALELALQSAGVLDRNDD
jgi:4-hydroxy-tetrahydrodipicolinate synthase